MISSISKREKKFNRDFDNFKLSVLFGHCIIAFIQWSIENADYVDDTIHDSSFFIVSAYRFFPYSYLTQPLLLFFFMSGFFEEVTVAQYRLGNKHFSLVCVKWRKEEGF